jgi:hypothetical protein
VEGEEMNFPQIAFVVIAVELGVLIYLLYSGVMALCDEIIATRTAVLKELEKIDQHLSVGFAKEIEEHNQDLQKRWAQLWPSSQFKPTMKADTPVEDPNSAG